MSDNWWGRQKSWRLKGFLHENFPLVLQAWCLWLLVKKINWILLCNQCISLSNYFLIRTSLSRFSTCESDKDGRLWAKPLAHHTTLNWSDVEEKRWAESEAVWQVQQVKVDLQIYLESTDVWEKQDASIWRIIWSMTSGIGHLPWRMRSLGYSCRNWYTTCLGPNITDTIIH